MSDGPLSETWGGLNHEFVLTRSVRDTAALLDALAGRAQLRIRVLTTVERDAIEPAMLVEGGRAMSAVGYQAALESMHAYSRRLESRWETFG